MKLALDSKSATALRELADAIPGAVANITDDTVKLITTYQAVSDKLGSHRTDFYLMLLHIQKAQTLSIEALEVLPTMMHETADKIDTYIATKPQVIMGRTVGADGTVHEHCTIVKFSSEASSFRGVQEFRTDASQAQHCGNKNYSTWQRSLTKSQRNSIYAYSGDDVYRELNSAKRACLPLSPDMARINEDINTALRNATLPNDVVVYRALSENAMRELALFCCQGNIEAGTSIQDAAFMSCSLIGNNAFTNDRSNKYIFRLAAPAGIHAAYIGNLSSHPYEQELLVDGDHFIHITSVTQCSRSEITGKPFDSDIVTVIDGILTI